MQEDALMRRTVALEIDQEAFSAAFRTLSGQDAKDLLVMLAFGGHSVDAHSACLCDIGIRQAPPSADPAAFQREADANVARAAEAFLAEASAAKPSMVLDGLADRPRPGAKQKARDSFTRLLRSLHRLRTTVEFSKPLQLVGSGGEEAARSTEA